MTQIDKRTKPMYDAATVAFTAVVDAARTKKRHTVWVERALFELSRIDPNLYQVLKFRLDKLNLNLTLED